jgi:hypothetical protein
LFLLQLDSVLLSQFPLFFLFLLQLQTILLALFAFPFLL